MNRHTRHDPGTRLTQSLNITDRFATAHRALSDVGQEHVLRFYDDLDDAGRDRLLRQVEAIDWPQIGRLVESHVRRAPTESLPSTIEPAPWYPNEAPADLTSKYAEARRIGEQLVRDGRVAAFTVAGGQGTRLGSDDPKGMYPATPLRRLPLFRCLSEFILKTQAKYRAVVPWYVMTSPANDEATRRYFDEQKSFGLDPANVMIFPQGMMPAFAPESGRVLLTGPDALALSPNGHGGSLSALWQSGALDDMKRRGVEQISYTQVDNPIVRVVDPLFLGLHAADDCQISSKAVAKTDPGEKVGVFCRVDGRIAVIEYSDLPRDLAGQRLDSGALRFSAGSIAIHAIRRDFAEAINASTGRGLPFHRALKKVSHLDLVSGRTVNPSEPNAVKLEMFVFDALQICDRSIVYETDRVDEFAPIKNEDAPNADDSVDSPGTSRAIQIERVGRWLETRGVRLPRDDKGRIDASIEIGALTAIDPDDLKGVALPERVEAGGELLL